MKGGNEVFNRKGNQDMSYTSYRAELISRFWDYQESRFNNWQEYFDNPKQSKARPPVFLKKASNYNIILSPTTSTATNQRVIQTIPVKDRHRWFHSMTSSQALAQSVFGNLKIYNQLHCLAALKDDSGLPVFENASFDEHSFIMEHSVKHLKEPRSTSIDALFGGNYQIAVECKLSEQKIGDCSRTKLKPKDNSYIPEYCDGNYVKQMGRKTRCSLTELEIKYWEYIPVFFEWSEHTDHAPCPLRLTYQLVRNILSVCVRPDGSVSSDNGHVVLIYDERNPDFQNGGDGNMKFEITKSALKKPSLLRKCSWQEIVKLLREKETLKWLTDELELKYGL
jgi:hypothetical protein